MIKILLIIVVFALGLTIAGCGRGRDPGSGDEPPGVITTVTQYPGSVETPNDVYYGPQVDDEEDIGTEDDTGGGAIETGDDPGGGDLGTEDDPSSSDLGTENDTGGGAIEPLTADVDTDVADGADADDDADDDAEDDEEFFIFEDGPVPVYYGAEFFADLEDEEEFE